MGAYLEALLDARPLAVWDLGAGAGDARQLTNKAIGAGTFNSTLTRSAPGLVDAPEERCVRAGGGWIGVADADLLSPQIGATGRMSLVVPCALDSLGVNRWLFTKADNPYEWGLAITTGNQINLNIWDNTGGGVMFTTAGPAVVARTPMLVAISYDRNVPYLRLFLNGTQVGETTTVSGLSSTNTTSGVSIGRRGDGSANPWAGAIQYPAIFDRALSPNEHRTLAAEFFRARRRRRGL